MFEFDTNFVVDTGNLTAVYTGSGVHLNKDVNFSFSIIDPQGNLITTDAELIANPLTNIVSFDILDSEGNLIFENYKSGTTSRSLNVTAIENESIFGVYTKDFGVRAKITNNVNSNVSISEFYAYGNIPIIESFQVTDGIFNPYNDFESGPLLEQIQLDLVITNSPEYIDIIQYDLYVSESDNITLFDDPTLRSRDNPYFLYSQGVDSIEDINQIIIKPVGLLYNVDYYFAAVPYSTLGSGQAIFFGPKRFVNSSTGDLPILVSANEFELFAGDETVNMSLITGAITGDFNLLDTIPSGTANTILYTVQLKSGVSYISSELKLAITDPLPVLLESVITNSGQLIYSVDQDSENTYLSVSGAAIDNIYKIYKTTL